MAALPTLSVLAWMAVGLICLGKGMIECGLCSQNVPPRRYTLKGMSGVPARIGAPNGDLGWSMDMLPTLIYFAEDLKSVLA